MKSSGFASQSKSLFSATTYATEKNLTTVSMLIFSSGVGHQSVVRLNEKLRITLPRRDGWDTRQSYHSQGPFDPG